MDPGSPLFHAKHILRALLLFFLGIVGLIVLRSTMQPETWGEFGSYRGASVAEFGLLPVRHGGAESCAPCHEDEFEEHGSGGHATVNCEFCHAAVSSHAMDDEWFAEMPVPETTDLCVTCHGFLVARPADFPQIDVNDHLEENDAEPGSGVCFECHEPHMPL